MWIRGIDIQETTNRTLCVSLEILLLFAKNVQYIQYDTNQTIILKSEMWMYKKLTIVEFLIMSNEKKNDTFVAEVTLKSRCNRL